MQVVSGKQRLAFRLAVQSAILALSLALLVSLITALQLLKSLPQEQEGTRKELLAATLPAFNLATFNYNSRLNQHLADGLSQYSGIASVIVLNTQGTIQAKANSTQACTLSETDFLLFGEPTIDVTPLSYAGTHLGKLIIETDLCPVTRKFYLTLRQTLGFSLLFATIVSAFVYAAFYRRITRPLQELSARISAINASNIESVDLSEMKAARDDELGLLMRSAAELFTLLQQHIRDRRQQETDQSEYSAKLEMLVRKRTEALSDLHKKPTRLPTEEHDSGAVPLLSVLEPEMRKFLTPLQNSLPADEAQQLSNLISLAARLTVVEIPESPDLVDIHEALQHQDYRPENLQLRLEAPGQLILARKRLNLLIQGLFNIADQTDADSLSLTTRYRHNQLEIDLGGDHFSLACSQLNAIINDDFSLASGAVAAIAKAMKGRMDVLTQEDGKVILRCSLPARWLEDELLPLKHQLRHTALFLDIDNDILNEQIKRWLSSWDVPFHLAGDKQGIGSVTLTDHHDASQSHAGITLPLTLLADGEPYRPIHLLNDLQHLTPDNKATKRALNVLLVDDNTINRMLCQRFLKNLGISPETADNGLQALEQCRRRHYDLILMDCQMPVMDGMEATRQIRRHSINMKTPIIALTGLTGEQERHNCLTAGMNDFISKPFTQDQIQATLLQWLESDGQDFSSAEAP